MSIFESHTYRSALRTRQKEVRLTWRKIADKIPLQYTFLSKCLNDEATHLNEDHLFRVCELLDFLPSETEFLLLLRARDTARQPSRREFLSGQIEKLRKLQVVRAEHRQADHPLSDEVEYLLDPLAALVRTSLFIKDIRRAPMRLTSLLGITPAHLKRVLRKLEKVGFIELGGNDDQILAYHHKPLHWGRQHPLMRAHQTSMKLHLLDRLRASEEDDKESFFVTYTMDQNGFNEVKVLMQDTLKGIQRICEKDGHSQVFQFSMDLLRVL